jgi:GH15 family glucan-1,4-alpha-glucosidase
MSYAHTQRTSPTSKAYLPIEDYGVIGDLYTVALVGKNGSIDWCCLPDFDSPSVFGAILDSAKGGFFRIAPVEAPGVDLKQMYLPNTNILITRFLSTDGVAFHSENLDLVLSSTIPLEEDGQGGAHARFTLHAGQWAYFFLQSASDHSLVPHQPTQDEYQ